MAELPPQTSGIFFSNRKQTKTKTNVVSRVCSSNFHLALSVVLLRLQSKHMDSTVCTWKLMYWSAGLARLEWGWWVRCSVSVSHDVNKSVSSINPEILSWVRNEGNEDNCNNNNRNTCSFFLYDTFYLNLFLAANLQRIYHSYSRVNEAGMQTPQTPFLFSSQGLSHSFPWNSHWPWTHYIVEGDFYPLTILPPSPKY